MLKHVKADLIQDDGCRYRNRALGFCSGGEGLGSALDPSWASGYIYNIAEEQGGWGSVEGSDYQRVSELWEMLASLTYLNSCQQQASVIRCHLGVEDEEPGWLTR